MEIKTPAQAAERAILILGGIARAARVLNVKGHQTIQSWLKNRVPAEYCPPIEHATRERGDVVLCEELRPDIPWSVLRNQAMPDAAPDAPSLESSEVA